MTGGLERWCATGKHWVPRAQAVPISPVADECMSGPGVMRWACRACLAEATEAGATTEPASPTTTVWTGRPDAPPLPPGAPG